MRSCSWQDYRANCGGWEETFNGLEGSGAGSLARSSSTLRKRNKDKARGDMGSCYYPAFLTANWQVFSRVRWRDDLQRPGQWGRVESLECVHPGSRGSSLPMGIVSNMSGFRAVQDDGMLGLPVEHRRTPMSNHSSRTRAESSQRRLSAGCLIDNAGHRIPQGPEFDTRH
ncbi:hypothetical protein BJX68DRAFT_132674 [Aspergillus pseudodeflectus]|uniref:Uncharacterized protein n=1 Tax=Aspergillus pseudodeflectus TaxID=176178 RepID=A0ABR4JZS8_9EURO